MRRRWLGMGGLLLLLGLAIWLFRSRGTSTEAAEAMKDGSAPSTSLAQQRHHRLAYGVPTLASQSHEASQATKTRTDGGQTALSIKTVRSLFEVSAMLHRNAIEAAENVDRYCDEAAKLPKPLAPSAAVDPDDPNTQEHDAAYFLSSRVSWETRPRTAGTLELPDELVQRLRAVGDGWATALNAADTAGLDFAWMSRLAQFDHWSLATVGPFADQAATADPMLAPIPYYLPLMDWAKLRLVRALATGDASSALGEVQHLAELMASNGILIAEFSAVRVVLYEQQFETAAFAAGVSLPATPRSFSQADDQSFQDLALAGASFMFPGVDPEVAKRGLGCSPTPCVLLSEWIGMRRELDSFTDTAEEPSTFGLADRSACDRALFEALETSPSAGIEALDGYMGSNPLPLERMFGPQIRPGAER